MLEFLAGKAALGAVSGIFGVISGFVGNLFTQYMNLKMLKEKNAHDLALLKARSDATIAEINANIQITRAQVEGAVDLAEMQAFGDSVKDSNSTIFKESYMALLEKRAWTAWTVPLIALAFAVVDFMTRIARPVLTYAHVAAVAWLYYLIYQWVSKNNIQGQFWSDLFVTSVMTIIYMYATIVGWWFCDRGATKFVEKYLVKR